MGNYNRILLGIEELDYLLDPGLIKGSVILIAGHPGVGKTTFASQIIYNQVKLFNRKALMISFTETKNDFYTYMEALGFNFKKYEEEGKFRFLSLLTISEIELVNKTIEAIMNLKEEYRPNVVVIDGFTALTKIMKSSQLRAFLHSTLIPILKELDLSLLISDLPIGSENVGHGVEEFIVDAVILMKLVRNGIVYERIMEFRKTRGSPLRTIMVPYVIKRCIGIKPLITILPRKENIKYDKLDLGLPEELMGRVPYNAQILITGVSGSGKSALAMHIACSLARKNLKIAYISLNETRETTINRLRSLGYSDIEGKIDVKTIDIYTYTMSETIYEILEFIKNKDFDTIIIDDIRVLEKLGIENIFWRELVKIITILRKAGITGIYIYTSRYPEEDIPIDTFIDIILILLRKILNNEIKTSLIVWKNRFKPLSHQIVDFYIENGKGVKIGK